jgi:hypothetical protein
MPNIHWSIHHKPEKFPWKELKGREILDSRGNPTVEVGQKHGFGT